MVAVSPRAEGVRLFPVNGLEGFPLPIAAAWTASRVDRVPRVSIMLRRMTRGFGMAKRLGEWFKEVLCVCVVYERVGFGSACVSWKHITA